MNQTFPYDHIKAPGRVSHRWAEHDDTSRSDTTSWIGVVRLWDASPGTIRSSIQRVIELVDTLVQLMNATERDSRCTRESTKWWARYGMRTFKHPHAILAHSENGKVRSGDYRVIHFTPGLASPTTSGFGNSSWNGVVSQQTTSTGTTSDSIHQDVENVEIKAAKCEAVCSRNFGSSHWANSTCLLPI